MTSQIKRAHIGRSVGFRSSRSGDAPLNGVIERIKNGIATVRYYVVRDRDGIQQAFCAEGFVAYLGVRDGRIIEIF